MDLSNLMQMAGQVKEQMENAQADAAKTIVTGESGGGMVKIVMNGNHEVTDVTIDPAIVNSEEVALLEDLVRAALNQASSNVQGAMKDRMNNVVSGMGLDLSSLGIPK